MVRWLKKSSKDVNNTWQHMHLILRWLKIRTIHFSLISFSKYWSRVFWPKWLTFLARKNRDGSQFGEKLNSRQKWIEFWAISTYPPYLNCLEYVCLTTLQFISFDFWTPQIQFVKLIEIKSMVSKNEKNESQHPFLIGRLRKSRLSCSSPNGRTFLKPYVKTEKTVFRPAVTDL